MAAGSGLTAAADTIATKTVTGQAGGFSTGTPASSTGANWVSLYTTQFSAAAKAGATEWLVASDGAYARQPMGATGAGWTINAYVSATGVQFFNNNSLANPLAFPAVTLNAQNLYSVGFCDAITAGNIILFSDLPGGAATPVSIGIQVQFNTTGSITSDIVFTTY